jgi:hypothetical protein
MMLGSKDGRKIISQDTEKQQLSKSRVVSQRSCKDRFSHKTLLLSAVTARVISVNSENRVCNSQRRGYPYTEMMLQKYARGEFQPRQRQPLARHDSRRVKDKRNRSGCSSHSSKDPRHERSQAPSTITDGRSNQQRQTHGMDHRRQSHSTQSHRQHRRLRGEDQIHLSRRPAPPPTERRRKVPTNVFKSNYKPQLKTHLGMRYFLQYAMLES